MRRAIDTSGRGAGGSEMKILPIAEWAAGGHSSTKWRPPISLSPTMTSATIRYCGRILYELSRCGDPSKIKAEIKQMKNLEIRKSGAKNGNN